MMQGYRPLLLALALAVGTRLPLDAAQRDLPREVTPEVDAAIRRGLDYLAAAQDNSCWSSRHGNLDESGNTEPYTVYHTGLTGLVLLQSGSTPHEGPYAKHIMRAVTFLMSAAQKDGFISIESESPSRPMYGHGMAMLFLSQAYGMLQDVPTQKRLRAVLERAVAFSARYQSRNGGWFYTPDPEKDEGSVAITQIHGLRACHNAGIPVPQETIKRFIAYLESLEAKDGGLLYQPNHSGKALQGVTAAGAASFFLAGDTSNPLARRLQHVFSTHLNDGTFADGDDVIGHKHYIRFCTGTALFLWDDPLWPTYYRQLCTALLSTQQDNGRWTDPRLGAVYPTAMALYALQLPYRQLPILQQ